MTFIPIPNPLTVTQDGSFGSLDAFQRLRVANPSSLMFTSHQYDVQTLIWDDALTGSATVTHDANNSAANLNVTTASGDKVEHRTIDYFRYQPGKSQQILTTFQMAPGEVGLEQRVGYFDDDNGIFLELDDTTTKIVLRSKATGSVVDTEIAQANWNVDAFDGNGTSGLTLDLTKSQILVIDLQWLGVGRVRVGFDIDGIISWAHYFDWANDQTGVYMTTANLPVTYEIETTGVISGAATFKAICSSVASEGGTDINRGFPFSQVSDVVSVGSSTESHILIIRPRAQFNSIDNHGQCILQSVEAFAEDQPCICRVYYDATSITTPSWVNVETNSHMEYDLSAAAFSSTHVLKTFFVAAATGAGQNYTPGAAGGGIGSLLPISRRTDGTTIPIIVTMENLSSTSAVDVAVALNWIELR
jgi:hypothetical protein